MPIYLDYNATAPMRPQVRECMQALQGLPLNPSSVHRFGRDARKILEDARTSLAAAISAFPNEIIFMGCATEANNAVLRGFPGHRVLVSAVEHSSVLAVGAHEVIPVDVQGIVDLTALDAMFAGGQPVLVSIMLANNETGVVQPVRDIAEICRKNGALLHIDAVQALGKIPVDFSLFGVDAMTIAAHKMGGPVGAAALVVRQNVPFTPFLAGGGQELRRRAGTENVAAIAGFAKAVELVDFAQMQALRGWLDGLEAALPQATIFGKPAPRLPNTTCLALPNITQEVLLMKLDLAGIAVSAGSACSSGRVEPSHVLLAMGVEKAKAGAAIRLSGGWNTTHQDIQEVTEKLRSM